MRDLKTFNQWLSLYGLEWTPGQEQMIKSTVIDQTEAEALVREYYNSGYLKDKE